MFKKLAYMAAVTASASIITGCASVDVAKEFNTQRVTVERTTPVAHVNGSTWGLYCLNIPLITGSTKEVGQIAFGEDSVNIQSVVDIVTKKSKMLGATKTTDLTSSNGSTWIPIPPFVFFLKATEVSGNAVK